MRHAGLDWLRLGAAALLMFAHSGSLLFPAWPYYDSYLFAGLIGVDLFFSLSGFLAISALLQALPSSATEAVAFGRRRLWRVLPGYWLFIVINVALWGWLHGSWPDGLWPYPLLLQNVAGSHPAFFGEAWNLPVLMAFAVLAPWLAWWSAGRSDPLKTLRNLLLVLALIGLLVRIGLVIEGNPVWDAGVKKWLLMRLDACAWGGVVACWIRQDGARARTAWLWMSGVAVLILAALAFVLLPLDTSVFARSGLFMLSALGTALLLPACLKGQSGSRMAALSRACYALYLVNMPLLHLALFVGLAHIGAVWATVVWGLVSLLAAILVDRFWIQRWRVS